MYPPSSLDKNSCSNFTDVESNLNILIYILLNIFKWSYSLVRVKFYKFAIIDVHHVLKSPDTYDLTIFVRTFVVRTFEYVVY